MLINTNIMKHLHVNTKVIQIGLLYFFLIAGGLWHILDVFQTLMRILAAPIMIGLAVWIFIEFLRDQSHEPEVMVPQHELNPFPKCGFLNRKATLVFWSLLVIVGGYWIEWLGIHTRCIFGSYSYGEVLQPNVFGVPIAIGFAWLCMLLSSVAVIQRLYPNYGRLNIYLFGVMISLFMVIFDGVMEPAATRLGYWNWHSDVIPVQNFVAWFSISFIFALFGLKLGLFYQKLPGVAFHAFFAQLIYFGMVIFK